MRLILLSTVMAAAGCLGTASAMPTFRDATANLPARGDAQYATMDAQAVDLDGDGDLDIVTPQEWRANRILINDGHGRFAVSGNALPAPPESELQRPPQVQQPLQKDSEDVSAADFDGDGDIDLIIVTEDDIRFGRHNVHQYFRAIGSGRYERVYGQLPDTVANAVAHADITGDGAPDVIISGDGQDRLLINDGHGAFRDETDTRLPREAELAQDVQFFDADGDRDLDLVLGLEGGHALWINDGQGRFTNESQRLPVAGNVEARKVAIADVDRDGDLDLYFAHVSWQGREPQDRLYLNDGRGNFTDGTEGRIPAETELSLDAAFADLDADGDVDLVRGDEGAVRVFENDGRGHFAEVTAQTLQGDFTGANITVEVADFDGDRRPDIFVGQLNNQGPAAFDRLYLNTTRR